MGEEPPPPRVDGGSIIQHFLTGESLRKVFAHLCNHASSTPHAATDPISDVVHTMLTCPVQMVISEVGVALFRDHPNAMFPFSAMDEGQRKYVEGVVASCMAQFARQRDAAVSVNNSSSIAANVVMQMGGGCILYAESSSGGVTSSAGPCSSNRGSSSQQQLLLRPKDVFETLCDCIFASKRYGSARVRYAVCSLVMQRVVGMMHVARADQQAVHLYALKLLKREGEEEFECDE